MSVCLKCKCFKLHLKLGRTQPPGVIAGCVDGNSSKQSITCGALPLALCSGIAELDPVRLMGTRLCFFHLSELNVVFTPSLGWQQKDGCSVVR